MEEEAERRIEALQQQIDALVLSLQELVSVNPQPEGAKLLMHDNADALVANTGTSHSRSVRRWVARWFPLSGRGEGGSVV